ncbi:hypothetical protein F2Q68_00017781, partial [Brassica cretica]
MDEDKRAHNAKQQALKPTASKTSDAQEPRQHAPYKKKGPVYAISEDDQSGVVAAVHEPGWNVWERDTEGKTQQSRKPASANSKSSYDQNKFCKYHDMRGHDTKECRHLYEEWLASTSDGRTEVEPPKPKMTKNIKSWSTSKDKKKKEKPKARRKIFTIRATPSPAPSTTAKPEDDLRQLNQKSGKTIEEIDGAPLRISRSIRKLNVSDVRHVLDAKRKDPLHRQDEIKRELWSNNQSDCIETIDLRIKLNSKIPDLREKLKRCKTDRSKAEPEPIAPNQRQTQDLRPSNNGIWPVNVDNPVKTGLADGSIGQNIRSIDTKILTARSRVYGKIPIALLSIPVGTHKTEFISLSFDLPNSYSTETIEPEYCNYFKKRRDFTP